MRLSILTLLLASSFAMAAAPATKPAIPTVGDAIKDFATQTPAGEAVMLSSLNSNGPAIVVILRGWPGYQCPICTKQVADLMAHAKDFEKAGAQVLLIYPGPADKLKEHAEDFVKGKTLPGNFTLAIDPDFNLINAWGLRWNAKGETAYPSTFIISKDSKVTFAKTSKTHSDRASSAALLKALEK